ncbi:AAA family ATPase, partial [Jiella avicenniae]
MSTATKEASAVERAPLVAVQGNILRSSYIRHLGNIVQDVRSPPGTRDRHIIEGVIPNGLSLLFGPSGCGKTGIAINMALAVGSGSPWAGIPVSKGGVIYLTAEDHFGVLDRLAAACEAAGLNPTTTHVAVKRFDEPEMTVPEAAKQMAELTGEPVRLIIVDTLSAAFPEEDQDRASGATKIMRALQTIQEGVKAGVLVLHHPGKGGGRQPTGSGVFFNRSDSVIRAEKRAGFTSLTVEKRRDGPTGAAFRYEIAGHPFETSRGTLDLQVIRDVRPTTESDIREGEEKQKRYEQTDTDVATARLRELDRTGPVSLKAWQAACFAAWAGKPSDGVPPVLWTRSDFQRRVSECQEQERPIQRSFG